MRVVDLTDPENLRLVSDVTLPGAETMYVQFQDEFAFLGSHKVDMRTFSSVLRLDTEGKQVDTSQFLLPLGNLLATGGVGEHQGLAIWAHQAAPDTRGPGVGYHLPRNGQTNYPRGAPISLLIHETLDSTTIKPGVTFIVRPLGGAHVPGKAVFAFDDILTFTPDQNLQPNTTYEVLLTAGGIKDAAGNGIEEYRFLFSTGATLSGNTAPSVTSFTASPHPARPGQSVAFSAIGQDPENGPLEYRFDFGDGSPKTAWSPSPAANHVYAAKGRHVAKVHLRDAGGLVTIAVHTVTVTDESATNTPPRSTEVEVDAARRTVWTVNPDHGTVTALDADSLARRFEAVVGEEPRGLAVDTQGRAWVACRRGDRIARVRTDGTTLPPIALDYGDAPHGIVIHPGGASAFVSFPRWQHPLCFAFPLGARPRGSLARQHRDDDPGRDDPARQARQRRAPRQSRRRQGHAELPRGSRRDQGRHPPPRRLQQDEQRQGPPRRSRPRPGQHGAEPPHPRRHRHERGAQVDRHRQQRFG
jgi:hypothetical protein